MIRQFIQRLFLRRHFWRYATFGEIAELYASRMLRMFALKFVTAFTSVYLLHEGYSLLFLCFFWAGFYLIKMVFSWPAALIAARFGPKHGILYSNIISAVGMVLLALVPEYGIWVLVAWCVLQALSSTLNDLCFLIDFSKVKSVENAGKEIGFMNIVEKIATGISPVVGGVVASLWSPNIAIGLSSILFLMSAWPLMRSKEPTRLRQKLTIGGFPWRTTWRSLVSETAIGIDTFATGTTWTLFIALVVFANDGNEIYAKIGALASLTLLVSLIASYVFGHTIDRRGGRTLLVASAMTNSVVHLFRSTIQTWVGVVASNSVNEVVTTGYAMAFTRGMFDTADKSGHRILYLFFIELTFNLGQFIACLILALCCILFDGVGGFGPFYAVAAILTLAIGFPRFMLYKK